MKQRVLQPFKVACVQFNPIHRERDVNVHALVKVVRKAAENKAKLIVTPEMATTGYHYESRDAITPFVDTIPGYTTDQFLEVCCQNRAYVVIGMAEVDRGTGLYYNSAALVGPDGYIGKYRKTHLWETEGHWAVWGDMGVPVFETSLGNIAINICMDSIYFESARLAALQGADILVFPTNSTAQSISLLQTRAETNGLYVVSANRTNTEESYHMIGASAVWSPLGEKLAESSYLPTSEEDMDETTILYAEIDPALYRNEAKIRLEERRSDLYKELMLYKAPWDFTKNETSRNLTVAAVQFEPVIGNKFRNLGRIEELISSKTEELAALSAKLDFVVLPELCSTGPVDRMTAEERERLAETTSGFTVEFMGDMAVKKQISLVFGFLEQEGQHLYNTAIYINPNGEIVGKYRQTHLRLSDKIWATPGDKISVFSSKEAGRIGIMIGYDALFPEVAGVLAIGRADIIAIPSSWNGKYEKEIAINRMISKNTYPSGSISLFDGIAIGSQAYTIVANFTATPEKFKGRSGLYALDPLYGLDQTILASPRQETVLCADITTVPRDWWFTQEKLIASRRTDLYKPLI